MRRAGTENVASDSHPAAEATLAHGIQMPLLLRIIRCALLRAVAPLVWPLVWPFVWPTAPSLRHTEPTMSLLRPQPLSVQLALASLVSVVGLVIVCGVGVVSLQQLSSSSSAAPV